MAKKKAAHHRNRPGEKKPEHRKSPAPKHISQTYARKAIASLGAADRPPAVQWKPGTAGTAPDGVRFVHYGRYIRAGGDRSWRINNPGNIKIGAFARANGAIGRDGQYAIFPDTFTGTNALMALLKTPAYGEKLVREVLSDHVTNLDGIAEAKARATRYRLDPTKKVGSLNEKGLTVLVRAITSTAVAGKPRVYKIGDQSNQNWAQDVLNAASPGTTVARGAGPQYFPYPDNWNDNSWYEHQPDGTFTLSGDQNFQDLVDGPGWYVRYEGNDTWSMTGRMSPGSDAGAPDPEDGPDAGCANPPGETQPDAVISIQFTRADGSTYTIVIVPPGGDLANVPPNAEVVITADGTMLVMSNDDGSDWNSTPESGGETPPDQNPPANTGDPEADNGGTTQTP